MASTSVTTQTSSTKPNQPQAALPIRNLNSNAANVYTHIHPVIVLSGYYALFQKIVDDPLQQLSLFLLPLAILQTAYVIVCLPVTGSQAGSAKGPASKPAQRKKGDNPLERVVPALLALTLSLAFGVPLLAIVAILFGAPLTTHTAHTLLLAAHLSLLSGYPLVYVYGMDTEKWRQATALLLPIDEVSGGSLGALVGAWVGAIPIPLDWDRDWQKWPITIVSGAYAGWAIGRTMGALLFRGKVIDLSS